MQCPLSTSDRCMCIPRAKSMRSVWSREWRGSMIETGICAAQAASRMQLFPCALEVSLKYSIVWSCPPNTLIGSPPCCGRSAPAAISVRGFAARRIGRRLRLASPTKVVRNGCAAAMPARRRALVPLLPQSTGADGAFRPLSPTPRTEKSAESVGIAAPRWRRTDAVDWTSADWRMPRIRELPSLIAANISARCEIDLSPGTRMLPCTRIIGSPQPTFERGGDVGLLVAVFRDHRRLKRETLARGPVGLDRSRSGDDDGVLRNLERRVG